MWYVLSYVWQHTKVGRQREPWVSSKDISVLPVRFWHLLCPSIPSVIIPHPKMNKMPINQNYITGFRATALFPGTAAPVKL